MREASDRTVGMVVGTNITLGVEVEKKFIPRNRKNSHGTISNNHIFNYGNGSCSTEVKWKLSDNNYKKLYKGKLLGPYLL